jgi:exodeoxyribonuclease X
MSIAFTLPSAPIVIVDVEGNGHNPPDLVELAIVPYPAENGTELTSWLIKPEAAITWQAERIHGIDNAAVALCPRWSVVQVEVQQHLEGKWFVAHNASVDYSVVKRHLPNWQPVGVIDTLRLARHVYPNAPSHGLEAMLVLTGLRSQVSELHRAGDDAYATALLLDHLFEKSKATSWATICKIAQIKTEPEPQESPPEQGSLW